MNDVTRSSLYRLIELPFPPAERIGARVEFMRWNNQPLHSLNVYFVGEVPETPALDRVLRECAALAIAHDDRVNLYVSTYRLADAGTDMARRETLNPYGRDNFLCFDAQMRQLGIRRVGTKRFVGQAEVIGPIATAQDHIDDATEDLLGLVEDLIWHGFDSAADIDALIEQSAAAAEGLDVAQVKAFAAATLEKKRATEAGWPAETDCDRLDRAFEQLQQQRVCALQCAGDTLDDGYEAVSEVINADDVPEDRYMGYCFFHRQDVDHALDGEGLLLAFGYLGSDEPQDIVAVGQLVADALRAQGLTVEWDGSAKRRIGVPGMRWQRRTPT